MFATHSESCRLVQGSMQAHVRITSEQRTEVTVGCAGSARYRGIKCRFFYRNKSGTAEVYTPLSLMIGTKAFSFYYEFTMED